MRVSIPESTGGRLRAWAMLVSRIDPTLEGPGAFQGPWLPRGQPADLQLGGIVLLYDERGSSRRPWVRICQIEADLKLVLEDKSVNWPSVLRDKVAAILPTPADPVRDAYARIVAILDRLQPPDAAATIHELKLRYGEAIP